MKKLFFLVLLSTYRVDWDGLSPPKGNAIEIPNTPCPLTADNHVNLRNQVNPLDKTTVRGMGIYQNY